MYVFFRPRKSYKSHKHTGLVTPDLSICGSNIEFVEKWPHLGHMISLNLSDDDDVSLRRQSLIGQINTVLCRFGRLDRTVKNGLFQAYCSSHYGSELWNLDCDKITEHCSTWRKGLIRIWELPYNFCSDYLSAILGTSTIYDELCRRFLTLLQRVILAILSSFVSLLGTQFIAREYSNLYVVITCCVTRDIVFNLRFRGWRRI